MIKKFFKDIVLLIIAKINIATSHESRDWEDVSLILSAKTLMNSPQWIGAPNFSDPFWLQQKEFQVYSQFGDDGIIQWLITYLNLSRTGRFIEFGVGDYFESNTHFLLVNNRWHGFVMDGNEENINTLRTSKVYWRYRLDAICSFITQENICDLLIKSSFEKIELLHIDLDGNDYWILNQLNLCSLNPDILILEYNAIFGSEREITIPYDPKFYRFNAHFSGKYFGASLSALNALASSKGYYFVGCNAAGNNAYFLSNRHLSKIPKTDVQAGFQNAGYRESRNKEGSLTYANTFDEISILSGLPVINIATGSQEKF
jgi:hypothetical protein